MVFSAFFGSLLQQVQSVSLVGKSLSQDNLLDVSGTIAQAQGIVAKPDGKMFVLSKVDSGGSSVNRVLYAFSGSTAWDASSMTHTATSSQLNKLAGDADTGFTDITSEDGINWYGVIDNNSIYHYQGTTAWDITTISSTIVGSYSVSGQGGSELGLCVSGNKLYYTNNGTTAARRLRCLDISSGLSSATEIYDIDINPTRPQAVFVSSDGGTAFITDTSNRAIYQYSIDSSAGTATREVTIDTTLFTPSITNPRGVDIEGDKIALADYGNSNITIFSVV